MIDYLNILNILFFSIICVSLQIFCFKKLQNLNIFFDEDFKKPQSVHQFKIPRIGGIILFIPLLFFFYEKYFPVGKSKDTLIS